MLEKVIVVPATETYDEDKNEFNTIPETKLVLKHSLLSVSKWEAKWKVPFLEDNKRKPKTTEMLIDYIRCMTISPSYVEPYVYSALTAANLNEVNEYINDPMTASKFRDPPGAKRSRQFITSELIYSWMVQYGIPFDPCEKWHLSRLMTLIRACQSQQTPPQKMKPGQQQREWDALNKARRAARHSKG